ncbi:MAG: cation diffusion facilitator family transporter [Spirochaetota bacterium]|nr:cation diffusion facilitator family transporter [Spirochaetota bacterium]
MEDHHEHSHTHTHQISSTGRFVLVVTLNVIITVAEYIGGIVSGSLALISDAGHNLSDVASLILGYIGQKVSQQKPGKKYSFGLKRFEVLIALVNAMTLLGIGAYIIYEAIERYINVQPVNPVIMLPIAFIGLAGNVISMLLLYKSRDENLNLKAAFLHLLYDAVSSVGVIIVGFVLLVNSNWVVLDLVVSVAIAFMIVASSLDIIKSSFRIFLQGVPTRIDFDEVYNSILTVPHVDTVHGLHIWSVDSNEVFLSCHVCISGGDSSLNTDSIIKAINGMLEEKFGITHTTLQIEHTNLCTLEGGSCCR